MKQETIKSNPGKAFKKGLSELRVKDLPEVREALYGILRITSAQSFRNYASGKVTLDIEKAKQIESLFAGYGITNPWGL